MGASDFLVSIRLDGKGFFPTIQQMTKETNALKSAFGSFDSLLSGVRGLGASIGIFAVANAVKSFSDRLDQLKDTADALGLSTTRTQQIGNVTDIDQARGAIEQLAAAQQAVLTGKDQDSSKLKAFAELGVTLDDIKRKDFPGLFNQLADSIGRAEISASKLVAIKEIFGKSGGRLVEGFQKGLDGAAANRNIISEEEVARAASDKEARKNSSVYELLGSLTTSATGTAAKAFTGLVQLPDLLARGTRDIFFGRPDSFSGAEQRAINQRGQEKIDARQKEKAEASIKQKEAEEKAEKESTKQAEKQKQVKDATAKAQLENREKLQQLFNGEMTSEEKKLSIARQRAEIQKQILSTTDELKKAQLIGQDLDLAKEGLNKSGGKYSISGDRLSKIGLFRGGGGDVMGSILNRQLSELRGINVGVQKLNDVITDQ